MDLSGKTMEELTAYDNLICMELNMPINVYRLTPEQFEDKKRHEASLQEDRRQIRQRIAQLVERERLDGFVIEGRKFLD
jgi:hypothetical protein